MNYVVSNLGIVPIYINIQFSFKTGIKTKLQIILVYCLNIFKINIEWRNIEVEYGKQQI